MSETREKILEVRDLGIDFGGLTAVNNLDMHRNRKKQT